MTRSMWLGRGVLALATLLFLMIGAKYVLSPAEAAESSGMSFLTLLGQTNTRAGVGGFSLGAAVVTLTCLASAGRLRIGLWFVVGLVAPVLLVRIYGVVVDGTFEASRRIVLPEAVLLILATSALATVRMTAARHPATVTSR